MSTMSDTASESGTPLSEPASRQANGKKTSTRCLRSRDKSQFSSFVRALEDPDRGPEYAASKRALEKRKTTDSLITIHNTPKKRRIFGPEQVEEYQDVYCWECHKQAIDTNCLDCTTCPRAFHPSCLPSPADDQIVEIPSTVENWSCPVCIQVTRAECVETRSWAMQMLTPEKFAALLLFALQRMKHADAEPFLNPVPRSELPDYYDVTFHPLDLGTLEKNVKKQMYASTEAFLEEAKWILHNCTIYNGYCSKFTSDAKLIMKICKHEMTEIEVCPECYLNSNMAQTFDNWFTEPCSFPHCLVWAKLKGFPYWPAKALRVSGNNNVDVRFFGVAHDRAWIPTSQCYLLSEELPIASNPKAKNRGMDQAMCELDAHLERIREKFGVFTFAPARTEFKKEHLYNCELLFGGDIAAKVEKNLGKTDTKTIIERRGRAQAAFAAATEDGAHGGEDELRIHVGAQRRMTTDSPSSSGGALSPVGGRSASGFAPTKTLSASDAERSVKTVQASMSTPIGRMKVPTNGTVSPKQAKEEDAVAAPEEHEEAKIDGVFTLDSTLEDELRELPDEICVGATERTTDGDELHRRVTAAVSDSAGVVDDFEARIAAAEGEEVEKGTAASGAQMKMAAAETAAKAALGAAKKRSLTSCLQKLAEQSHKGGTGSTAGDRTGSPLTPNGAGNGSAPGVETFRFGRNDGAGAGILKLFAERLSVDIVEKIEEFLGEYGADVLGGSVQQQSSAAASAETKSLREEVNWLRILHKQVTSELEHNMKLSMQEMQEQSASEKQRALDDLKRRCDEEKLRAVAETKLKQWCANCGKEAMFYCCWNTSYCDYPCQQQHWPKHQESCVQIRQQNSESHVAQASPHTMTAVPASGFTLGPQQTGVYTSTAVNAIGSNQQIIQYVPGPTGMVPVYAAGAGTQQQVPRGPQIASAASAQANSAHYPAMQPRPAALLGGTGVQLISRRR